MTSSSTNHPHDYFIWRLYCYASFVMIVGYLLSWGVLGFNLPPSVPAIPLNELYQHYLDHSLRIRAGQGLALVFAGIYMLYGLVMAFLIRETGCQNNQLLSATCQVGGGLSALQGMLCSAFWLVAAFRVEERTPEIVRLMHDLGWIVYDMTYIVITFHMAAAAYAFMHDKRAEPLMPRWLSWYSFLVLMTFWPLTLLPFFYQGPFAWSGLFDFWLSLGSWFIWMLLMSIYMLKAVKKLEKEKALAGAK